MTIEAALVSSIDAADHEACARALVGLTESERRAVYPAVARRVDEIDTQLQNYADPGRKQAFQCFPVARLALLGVATLGELRKTRTTSFFGLQGTVSAILADRQPDWLSDWAEFELARNIGIWPAVRALVRTGLIPRPATEFYVLGMIAAPCRTMPPRELLARDPQLLQDELWRLFEHEGSGELSLAAYDKYVSSALSWFDAFLAMAADGTIDRNRLLSVSLDALERDFAPFRAGWFSRLHEALKPGKTERASLCERYLDLLNSRVPATVSFAMKALVLVEKTGMLNFAARAERLAPAFEARDKGTVERALALLSKAAGGHPNARLAALAARALGHESPEIQMAALALIGNDTALVEPYLDVLAPSVRARLGAGLPAAPPALVVEADASLVEPIGCLSELVETFAAVLEKEGPPVDIERVIEGVSHLGIRAAARDSGFARLTAALARRAGKLLLHPDAPQPRTALAAFALAWIRGDRRGAPEADESLADFQLWRLWCVSEQAALRVEQPLLSLPTALDGRIDSGEMDRRLAALTPAQREATTDRASLFHLDFLLARLRAYGLLDEPRLWISWLERSWTVEGKTYSHFDPALGSEGLPAPSRFEPAALTCALLPASLAMARWCATVSPRWREGWFAAGCRDVGDNIDWHQADWSTRAYVEPLVNRDTPIGPMGVLLIALGLGAKESGEAGLAVDALIAATSDGRLDEAAFGRALTEAAASGVIPFSRWTRQLQRAAQAGSLQARTIFLALEVLLESGHGTERADFGRLVELEHELAHLTGLRITRAGAVRVLTSLKGNGKGGRAAAALLSI